MCIINLLFNYTTEYTNFDDNEIHTYNLHVIVFSQYYLPYYSPTTCNMLVSTSTIIL